MKRFLTLLKEAAWEWFGDNTFMLSAALSYYTAFSIAPVLLIVLFVVGLFWKDQSGGARERLIHEVAALVGPDGAGAVQTMLEHAEQTEAGGVLATVLGVIALLLGATAVFAQLQTALNAIWGVAPKAGGLKGNVRDFLLVRVLSFGLILALGFILLVSLLASAFLSAADELITGLAPGLHLLMQAVNLAVSFAVITFLFALIYRYLPDTDIAWRDVGVGAALTALLFSLGKLGIGAYLGNSSATSAYGAAGSFAVMLLWVYYSGLIIFFGAEFTKVYARRYGTHRGQVAPASPAAAPGLPAPVSPPAVPLAAAPSRRRPLFRRLLPFVLVFLAGRLLRRH